MKQKSAEQGLSSTQSSAVWQGAVTLKTIVARAAS